VLVGAVLHLGAEEQLLLVSHTQLGVVGWSSGMTTVATAVVVIARHCPCGAVIATVRTLQALNVSS